MRKTVLVVLSGIGLFALSAGVMAQGLVLTKDCEGILAKAQNSKTPAAFAASPDGKCGASWDYASTVPEAQSRALQWCKQGGGKNCKVRFSKK
jgi:hypothetical protein